MINIMANSFAAIYNYWQEEPFRLRTVVGDVVHVVEESEEWYYGHNKNNGTSGIFPKSYVHFQQDSRSTEPLLCEITNVLREWGHHWKNLYIVSIKYHANLSIVSRLE